MGKTRKVWFGVLLPLFVLLILGFSFYRFYLKEDFVRYDFVPCNTSLNSCFVTTCTEDDPRCEATALPDGSYAFSVAEMKNGKTVVHYCKEQNLAAFGDFVFDAECSN